MNMNTSSVADVEGLSLDMARLEMDRDSSDMVFVVGRVSGHAGIFNVRCSKFVDLSFLFSLSIPARRQPRKFNIKKKLFGLSHHADGGQGPTFSSVTSVMRLVTATPTFHRAMI